MPAAEYTRAFITSVVVGKDVVPRIGLHQMEAMRADLINAIQRSRDPKVNIMLCTSIVWLHFMFFVLKIRLSYIWYGVNFISLNYMRQLYIYLLVRVYQRHIFDGKIFPFFFISKLLVHSSLWLSLKPSIFKLPVDAYYSFITSQDKKYKYVGTN